MLRWNRSNGSNGFNPNLGDYFTAKDDALGILRGLSSSSFNLASLLTVDYPELLRRHLRNRMPIAVIKYLLDSLPTKDYHHEGNPVIFLRHGYLTGAASMKPLRKGFGPEWGINSHQYDFSANLQDLAGRFLKKVEVAKAAGKEVHVLGHSYGGLISLHACQQNPKAFDRILTMAVPYHGSKMADKYWLPLLLLPVLFPPSFILPSIDVRKFRTDDQNLAEFRRKGLSENVPILNLYSNKDEYVKPWENAKLPEQDNVTNICIPGISHNQFIYDSLVHQIAKMFLNGLDMDYRMPNRLDQALGFKQTARIEELVRVNDF